MPTNHCWCQKTRVIAVSCGIKISAVHHLVLSQYMRLTDRRTEFRQQYRTVKVQNGCQLAILSGIIPRSARFLLIILMQNPISFHEKHTKSFCIIVLMDRETLVKIRTSRCKYKRQVHFWPECISCWLTTFNLKCLFTTKFIWVIGTPSWCTYPAFILPVF